MRVEDSRHTGAGIGQGTEAGADPGGTGEETRTVLEQAEVLSDVWAVA